MIETVQPALRRVGIIGDVHGEDRALAVVLEYLLQMRSLEALICTGDLMDTRGMGDAYRCCMLLRDAGVLTVRGEFDDRYHLKVAGDGGAQIAASDETAARFIAGLPTTRGFDTVQGPLLLCHGFGESDLRGLDPAGTNADIGAAIEQDGLGGFRFIVAGHSHERGVRTVDDTVLINAGSLFWEDAPCFLVADFAAGTVQYFDVAPFTNLITPAKVISISTGKIATP